MSFGHISDIWFGFLLYSFVYDMCVLCGCTTRQNLKFIISKLMSYAHFSNIWLSLVWYSLLWYDMCLLSGYATIQIRKLRLSYAHFSDVCFGIICGCCLDVVSCKIQSL